ncbi:hypothetical protein VE02_07453 [Pseudogymnoascus sp. 03VT05]|nr:hypothetical protein VE02_07453 [Pseudogymnoascus sp. 03VT05]
MSSKVAQSAVKATRRVIPVSEKYTVQSTGIYERIRRIFAVDPTRSNGIPLNPQFRNPTPGALDPRTIDDRVTLPAADIAENPYWKRDTRRNYARASVVGQSELVQLLSVGNAKDGAKVELIGEQGEKALVAAKGEGEKGLAAFFREGDVSGVLGEGGLPPNPSRGGPDDAPVRYEMPEEQAYPAQYPCRTFA